MTSDFNQLTREQKYAESYLDPTFRSNLSDYGLKNERKTHFEDIFWQTFVMKKVKEYWLAIGLLF